MGHVGLKQKKHVYLQARDWDIKWTPSFRPKSVEVKVVVGSRLFSIF